MSNNQNQTEFVDGLIIKAPREGAPDFVKGSISIKRAELIQWLQGKQDDWVNLDIKESRGGKWYAAVNDWKPNQNNAPSNNNTPAPAASSTPSAPEIPTVEYPDDDISPEDIPF